MHPEQLIPTDPSLPPAPDLGGTATTREFVDVLLAELT